MGLRIFPVVGEALHFGGRRMETIARIAWLPLLLSLVASMAAVFAMLSVIADRLITFTDIPTYLRAERLLAENAARGFQNNAQAMWTIVLAGAAAQTLLTASFMAPLIRYAGLGEKPAPGVMRAPFGPDQVRFVISGLFGFLFVAVLVFGPVAAASFYTLKYVVAALSQTVATFPDPGSLHTIEIRTTADVVAARGRSWIYKQAIPLSGALPVGALFWLILFFHFAPHNRPFAPRPARMLLRALGTFVVAVVAMWIGYALLAELVLNQFRNNVNVLNTLGAVAGLVNINAGSLMEGADFLINSPAGRVVFFGVASFFVVNYLSLRLFAYPGVAVCRKSLAVGNTLRVTRGWNIIRLWVIVTLLSIILIAVQVYFLNAFVLQYLLPNVFDLLYKATAVTTRLVNSGAESEWVRPLFIWIWNVTKIVLNIIVAFFSFGVAAGLYGRLYRESERAQNS